jgi:hypothetical protein
MTAAASNAVKLELPGSVSISNVAGGGIPRFLRRRFVVRGIFRLPGDPNASIRGFSSLPLAKRSWSWKPEQLSIVDFHESTQAHFCWSLNCKQRKVATSKR